MSTYKQTRADACSLVCLFANALCKKRALDGIIFEVREPLPIFFLSREKKKVKRPRRGGEKEGIKITGEGCGRGKKGGIKCIQLKRILLAAVIHSAISRKKDVNRREEQVYKQASEREEKEEKEKKKRNEKTRSENCRRDCSSREPHYRHAEPAAATAAAAAALSHS